MHMQNNHEVPQLKVNECDKKFIKEWRLKKTYNSASWEKEKEKLPLF